MKYIEAGAQETNLWLSYRETHPENTIKYILNL